MHLCPNALLTGSSSAESCTTPVQACPAGTRAAAGASSAAQCVCLPGYGGECLRTSTCASVLYCTCLHPKPGKLCCSQHTATHISFSHAPGDKNAPTCSLCGAGSYSPGGSMLGCAQCPFGFSSPAGSVEATACSKFNPCSTGMRVPDGVNATSLADCKCLPGYGGAVVH